MLSERLKNIEFTDTPDKNEYKNDEIYSVLKERIVFYRKRAGLTQKQLAEISGVTQANISRMENGSAVPSIESLVKIADSLGLKLVIDFDDYERK